MPRKLSAVKPVEIDPAEQQAKVDRLHAEVEEKQADYEQLQRESEERQELEEKLHAADPEIADAGWVAKNYPSLRDSLKVRPEPLTSEVLPSCFDHKLAQVEESRKFALALEVLDNDLRECLTSLLDNFDPLDSVESAKKNRQAFSAFLGTWRKSARAPLNETWDSLVGLARDAGVAHRSAAEMWAFGKLIDFVSGFRATIQQKMSDEISACPEGIPGITDVQEAVLVRKMVDYLKQNGPKRLRDAERNPWTAAQLAPPAPAPSETGDTSKGKRVRKLSDFGQAAGPLMVEYAEKRGKNRRLPEQEREKLLAQLSRFKPIDVFEETAQKELGKYNQRHPYDPIDSLAKAWKHRQFRRAVQKCLDRARSNHENSRNGA